MFCCCCCCFYLFFFFVLFCLFVLFLFFVVVVFFCLFFLFFVFLYCFFFFFFFLFFGGFFSVLRMRCCVWKGGLLHMRTTNAQISLRICAGWSGHSLPAYNIVIYCYQRAAKALITLRKCAVYMGSPCSIIYGMRALFMDLWSCINIAKIQTRLHIIQVGTDLRFVCVSI